MKTFNDWVWKPDPVTEEALRRGDFKVRAYHAETKNLFHFHMEPVKQFTKKEIKQRDKDRDLVRAYVERISKVEPGTLVSKQQVDKRGGRMHIQWVALIDQSNKTARVLSKHETEMAARAVAGSTAGVDEYTVVRSNEGLRVLSDIEVDALMSQFDDKRTELKRPLKELIVRGYLEQFDPTWHEADGKVSNGHYSQPALPVETEMETQTGTSSKKRAAAPATKAAKKKSGKTAAAAPATKAAKTNGAAKKEATAPKAPKKRAQIQDKGDGLGREGTPARFIREQYKAGKETKEIFAAVVRKFPKNDIKGAGYVSWYYNDMVKRGLIKKAAKKD